MKTRFLLLFLTGSILLSCSDDAKLLRDAEKFLKAQLNDPDSYKRDSLNITLKVTQLKNHKNEITNGLYVNKRVIQNLQESTKRDFDDFKSLYEPYMNYVRVAGSNEIKKQYEDELWELNIKKEFIDKKIDSLIKVNEQLFHDSINVFKRTDNQVIQRIVIKGIFRAKNSFGAYIKQTAWIIWYPDKGFELNSIE
jgi:hypothetical protein